MAQGSTAPGNWRMRRRWRRPRGLARSRRAVGATAGGCGVNRLRVWPGVLLAAIAGIHAPASPPRRPERDVGTPTRSFGPWVITTGRFAARAKGVFWLSRPRLPPHCSWCCSWQLGWRHCLRWVGRESSHAGERGRPRGRRGHIGESKRNIAGERRAQRRKWRWRRKGPALAGIQIAACGRGLVLTAVAAASREPWPAPKSATSVRFAPAAALFVARRILVRRRQAGSCLRRAATAAEFAGAASAGLSLFVRREATSVPPRRARPGRTACGVAACGFPLFASLFVVFAEQPSKQSTARRRRLRHIGHHAAARRDFGAGFLVAGKRAPVGGEMDSLAVRETGARADRSSCAARP